MFPPEIDNIFERFSFSPDLIDLEIADQLKVIYKSMSCVRPGSDDEIRNIWLEIPRGNIENFGEFEEFVKEGIVATHEEFEEAFQTWYHSGERFGSHPWEICRGGNSTHISLYVSH